MRVAIAVLTVILLSPAATIAEDPDALARWQQHMDRADAHLKHREAEVTTEEIRAADTEYARAVEVARSNGMHDRAIEALKGRVDCLEANYEWLDLLRVEYQILAIQLEMGPDAAGAAALTRQDLGYLEAQFRNPSKAIRHLRHAEHYYLSVADAGELAQTRIRLANAYESAGQYGLALAAAEATEAWFRAKEDWPSLVEALGVLCSIHTGLGHYRIAQKCIREARELDPEGEIMPLGNVYMTQGRLHLLAGSSKAAREDFRRALLYAKNGDDEGEQRRAQLSLAQVSFREGKYEEVQNACREMLADLDGHDGIRVRVQCLAGRARYRRKDLEGAQKEFEAAIASAKRFALEESFPGARLGLAVICSAREEWDEALDHTEIAFRSLGYGSHDRDPLSSIEQRSHHGEIFDIALVAAFHQKDPARTLDIIERTRAGVVVDGLGGREALVAPGLSEALQAELDDARARLAIAHWELRDAVSAGGLQEARRATKKVRREQDAYRLALEPTQRGSPAAILSGGTPVRSLAELQEDLADGQVFVHYAFAGENLRALVVTKKTAARHDLGPREPVIAAAKALREEIGSGRDPKATKSLHALLIAPLGLPAGARRLVISPDGPLSCLPFGIIEPDRSTSFAPSATAWSMLKRKDTASGDSILAMGDPAYGVAAAPPSAGAYRGTVNLTALPSTRQEVLSATGPGDVRLLGKDATERKFLSELSAEKRWRSVHFACHGFYDRRRPSWSALALSPGDVEDGFLTVMEIFGLRVPSDLVVLSACETGVGRAVPGECVVALPTAFLHAGSSCVVASLWRVDDRATGILMSEFYRCWNPKPGKAKISAAIALKRAQEAVRKKGYEHPRFWAGWVLWGLAD